jgi:CheY-like chemotaxis protein/HPt (histidine-containing phosphotransfer) domain-containing protein
LELTCRIDPNVPGAIRGDPARLRQILINLVDNAIKFTETGEINLAVLAEGLTDGGVTLDFSVSDTGIGIPVEKQDAIFAAFAQADGSTTRNYGGTGLGLTISSRLVEQMRGRLTVESVPGKGSTFRFTARFESCDQLAPSLGAGQPDLAGLRVLAVDDSATNRRILEEILLSWRMSARMAANGEEALGILGAAAETGRPIQLILIDALMPQMNGFELARRIRNEPGLNDPGIMILSSAGETLDAARATKLGITACLTKPVNQSELFDTIIKASGFAQSGPEIRVPVVHAEPSDGPTRRILLVDDNAVNRAVARKMLETAGHEVHEEIDGLEAVEAMRTREFEIVLMDLQMPGLDGFGATARIRQDEAGKAQRTPIIAMTAHALTGDKERCLEGGMDDYLPKPIDRASLLEMVHRWTDATRLVRSPVENVAADGDLLARFDGDIALLNRLKTILAEQTPFMLDRLRGAIASHNASAVRETAHTLIGSLGALGATQAVDYARELENLAIANDFIPAQKTLTHLKYEMDSLQSRLANIC